MTDARLIERADGSQIALHHLAGDGPDPLLISHATGFHGRCYTELAEGLSSRWTVWALDYSGHGISPAPSSPLTDWSPFADDVLAVARTLAPEGGLAAFGHSMGGAAVLLAHLRDRSAFARLVAFEPIAPPPTPGIDPDELPIVKGAIRRRPGFESKIIARENYGSKPPLSTFTERCLSDYVEYGMHDTSQAGALLNCTPEFEASVFRGAHTNDLWDRLPTIHLRTDVIMGIAAEHQPSAFAPAVAQRLPNGSLHEHPEMDHFGPFVVPQACAALVEDLLGD